MLHKFSDQNLSTKQEIVELKHAIEMLEYRMTVKMGAMLTIAVGILAALQKQIL